MDGVQEVRHTHVRPTGSVGVAINHTSTGISIETTVSRPREDGETWEDATGASAQLALEAYDRAALGLRSRGLEPGPHKKGEARG